MLQRKFLILLSCIIFPIIADAEVKIITSTPPLASLIDMIGKDKVKIKVIESKGSCIHHHYLKPSELKLLREADGVILIHKDFDGKLADRLPANKVLYLSNIGFNLDPKFKDKFHLWLNINNAIIMLKAISDKLAHLQPEDSKYFKNNLKRSIIELQTLQRELNALPQVDFSLMVNSSSNLEHFFLNYKQNELTTHIVPAQNLQYNNITSLSKMISKNNYKCLIIDEEQPLEKFKKLFGKRVKVLSLIVEQWKYSSGNLSRLYSQYIKANHEKLIKCYLD